MTVGPGPCDTVGELVPPQAVGGLVQDHRDAGCICEHFAEVAAIGGVHVVQLYGYGIDHNEYDIVATVTSPPAAPANDDFLDATPIGGAEIIDGARPFDTTYATAEDGEPAPEGPVTSSVWFTFTGPNWPSVPNMVGQFTNGSEVAAALYRVTSEGAPSSFADLELLASGTSGIDVELVNPPLNPNETVYVQVYGVGTNKGPGDLIYGVGAANDDIADAWVLEPASAGSVPGNTVHASRESGEPATQGATPPGTIWWSWTAPAAGRSSSTPGGASSTASSTCSPRPTAPPRPRERGVRVGTGGAATGG